MKIAMFLLLIGLFAKPINGAELEYSVGLGLQYGGIIGYQLSTRLEQGRIRGAVGLVGASVGYDHFVTENFAIGVTFTETIRTVYSLNLSYMPNGLRHDGWMFAADLGHMPDDDGEGFFSTDGSKNVVWLTVGYRF